MSSDNQEPDSLALDCARALIALGCRVESLDDDGATVTLPGQDRSFDLSFQNLARSVQDADAARRAAAIERFARAALAFARPSPEPGCDALLARILPRLVAGGSPELRDLWSEPLADGALHQALVLDHEAGFRYLRLLDLPRMRLSVAAARGAALANLRSSSHSLLARRGAAFAAAPSGAVLEIQEGDGLDAARLLIAHQWFPGALGCFALVPGRDLLVLSPVWRAADVRAALGPMAQVWARAPWRDSPWPLSAQLFWRADETLSVVPLRQEGGRVNIALPDLLRERIEEG